MSSQRTGRGRALRAGVPVLVVLACIAGAAAAALARGGRHAGPRRAAIAASPTIRTLSIVCRSPALGGSLPTMVYLPPGYSSRSHRRYPVVYFLHGLPAGPTSYRQNGFVAAQLAATGRRAIVVAPQGARTAGSDREYLNWDATEDWPAAIAHDLTGCVDARYHTVAGRWGRALIGLSAGGFGAMNVGLRNLRQFAAVQSWSGYFVATDPSGEHVLQLGSVAAAEAATVPQGAALRARLAVHRTEIGFYVGNGDARFLTMNRQFDAALRTAGIAHRFAVYSGGHSYSLWRARAPQWLSLALSYLAAGRHRH